MNDLTPEDDALLRQARTGDMPTAEDQARVKRKLLLQLGVGVAVGTSATSASGGAASATGLVAGGGVVATVAKVVVAMSIAVGAVGSGVVILRATHGDAKVVAPKPLHPAIATAAPAVLARDVPATGTAFAAPVISQASAEALPLREARAAAPSSSRDTRESPSPRLHAPRPADEDPSPALRPAASAAPSPTTTGPEPPVASAGPATVAAEAELLRDADAALKGGDAGRALALLNEHSARFPKGILVEERDAERVVVLCALGRIDEARASAGSFLQSWPMSPLAGRVRASCGGL